MKNSKNNNIQPSLESLSASMKSGINEARIAMEDSLGKITATMNIGINEARQVLANMSFKDFVALDEAEITPPSGQTITPTSTQQSTSAPTKMKSVWPGKGAPIEVGMTVGLKGPNGLPVPGEVSQVDTAAKGVKVKNPTTGQEEWANIGQLNPYMVNSNKPGNQQQQQQQAGTQQTPVDNQLSRLQELAGIKENASCGASSAGGIAIAPAAMGGMKKRQPTEETIKKEYVPKEAAKTIVGDTKPAQASGELSATLAANGKKTASRTNNGFKR